MSQYPFFVQYLISFGESRDSLLLNPTKIRESFFNDIKKIQCSISCAKWNVYCEYPIVPSKDYLLYHIVESDTDFFKIPVHKKLLFIECLEIACHTESSLAYVSARYSDLIIGYKSKHVTTKIKVLHNNDVFTLENADVFKIIEVGD